MEPRRTKNPRALLPKGKGSSGRGVTLPRCDHPSRDVLATLSERASFVTNAAGKETHAVIPFDDYVYLMALQSARAAVPMLEDPNYEWVDADQLLADFAAPRIARARTRRGWTQKQLGARLGMPQSQVSRMEKNPDAMTLRTLQRVAKVLGVEVSSLL